MVPILLCGLGMWLVVGMGLAAGSAREVEDWAEGPVRWLLLPGELKELRNIYTEGGGPSSYIEIFWERRDPDLPRDVQEDRRPSRRRPGGPGEGPGGDAR